VAAGAAALIVPTMLTIPLWQAERPAVRATVTYLDLSGIDVAALESTPSPGDPIVSGTVELAAFMDESTHDESTHDESTHDAPAVTLQPAIVTAPALTEPFSLIGVVSSATLDPNSRIIVRVHTAGTWSAWQSLPVSDHGPDANTAEGQRARSTSEPLIAPDAQGVQIRIDTPDGTVPAGTQIAMVHSPVTPDDAAIGQPNTTLLDTAQASPSMPHIITRAQWGADESMVRDAPEFSDTIKVGFVHHVVQSNNYSPIQSAAIMRDVYSWFVEGEGVNDFGYNFMVDRFGRIFEGRKGSIEGAVIGAHTSGFNRESFAVSFLGNSDSLNPNKAQGQKIIDAYGRIMAWKLAQFHRNPLATAVLTSAGPGPGQGTTSKYWPGQRVRVPTILGHGGIGSTACPGKFLHASLAAIRASVAQKMGAVFYSPTVSDRDWGSAADMVVQARATQDTAWTLQIFSACGDLKKSLTGSVLSGAVLSAAWDGKDESGKPVPPGTYRFELAGDSAADDPLPWIGFGDIAPTATSPVDPCAPPDAFTINGSGYGHGVGLSQWGALSMAREGWGVDRILKHYYTGTTVATVDDNVNLRVGLMTQAEAVRLRMEGDAVATVNIGSRVVDIPAGAVVNTKILDGRVRALLRNGSEVKSLGSALKVTLTPTDGVVNVVGPGQDLTTGSRYRHGTIEVSASSGATPRLIVVNIVNLHRDYLLGIAEVVPTWPQAALRAQVIASRSYALYAYAQGVRADCRCHLNDGDAPYFDQTYRGADVVDGVGGANWAKAVDATEVGDTQGRAVLFEGVAIPAFYTAATGGRTMSAIDVWGGATPWAVSVDDAWSVKAPENPYRSWSATVSQADMADLFGLPEVMRVRVTSRFDSGAPKILTASARDGSTARIPSLELRSHFDLYSAYVTRVQGVTRIAPVPPVPPVTRSVTLDVSPAAPRQSDDVSLTGRVTPQGAGLTVIRQVRYAGQTTWNDRASSTTDADGNYSFTIAAITSSGSTYSWRIVVLSGSTIITTSPIRTVTIL
jgi:SpoIID/LytB domain protein